MAFRKETYQLDETFGVSTTTCRTWGVEGDGDPEADVNTCDTDTSVRVRLGLSKGSAQRYSTFLRFSTPTLPRGSQISFVKLRWIAEDVITGTGPANNSITIAHLNPNGTWEQNFGPIDSTSESTGKFIFMSSSDDGNAVALRVLFRDPSAVILGQIGIANLGFNNEARTNFINVDLESGLSKRYMTNYGQVVKVDTTGTLNGIDIRLNSVGSPPSTSFVRLWNVDSNFFPTTVVLETNTRNNSTITSLTNYRYFLDSTISITAGEAYMAEFISNAPYSDTDYVYWGFHKNHGENNDLEEKAYAVGVIGGFGQGLAMVRRAQPILYDGAVGLDIKTAPFGSVASDITFNLQTIGEEAEFVGFETPIQEWVNSPQYEEAGRIIGLVLDPGDEMEANKVFTYDHPIELDIEFEPSSEHFIT